MAKDWAGHDVLDLPADQWSMAKNDAWVGSGVANKQIFYTASPQTTQNVTGTVYGRELQQVTNAGYKKQGDYYVPNQ